LKRIVRINQIVIHTKVQPFPDFLELGQAAPHEHVNVGKLIIFSDLPNQFHAVEACAKAAVGDDKAYRTGLEVFPKILDGSETGNIHTVEHKLILNVRSLVGVPNRQIDIGGCQVCHG